jgi:hypothetical protein
MRCACGSKVTALAKSRESRSAASFNCVRHSGVDCVHSGASQYHGAPLDINTNPRNGQPEFNNTPAAFTTETLGQLGNIQRRFFYSPGIDNFDMTLTKMLRVTESKSSEFRLEGFNVFNRAQFYGAASVDGEENDPHFGQVASTAGPRLVQLGAKFTF